MALDFIQLVFHTSASLVYEIIIILSQHPSWDVEELERQSIPKWHFRDSAGGTEPPGDPEKRRHWQRQEQGWKMSQRQCSRDQVATSSVGKSWLGFSMLRP